MDRTRSIDVPKDTTCNPDGSSTSIGPGTWSADPKSGISHGSGTANAGVASIGPVQGNILFGYPGLPLPMAQHNVCRNSLDLYTKMCMNTLALQRMLSSKHVMTHSNRLIRVYVHFVMRDAS